MGVTWATSPLKEVVPPFEGGNESEVGSQWGFRVDGTITRRITKLFPPDDRIWDYGETEAMQVQNGGEDIGMDLSDAVQRLTGGVQGGRPVSRHIVGPNTAKLFKAISDGDISWKDESAEEDRGGRYDRRPSA